MPSRGINNSKDGEIDCSQMNQELVNFCKVMSDPTRFEIVSLLRNGELPVQEIASTLKKTNSNVSHQLRLLKLHQVVKVNQVAKFRLYQLTKTFSKFLTSFINLYKA